MQSLGRFSNRLCKRYIRDFNLFGMVIFVIKFLVAKGLALLSLMNQIMKLIDDRIATFSWILGFAQFLRLFLIIIGFCIRNFQRLFIDFDLMRADGIAIIFIIFGV